MMKDSKIEWGLIEMLLSVGLFELTGKYSLSFEQNNLGTSPLYFVLISLGGLAVFMFLHGAVKVDKFFRVKKKLNSFT